MSIDFRLDRTQFKAMTFSQADEEISDYSENTWRERFIIAHHLTSIAYNFAKDSPPAMDKSVFEVRKFKDG